jgi:hypothetical protein
MALRLVAPIAFLALISCAGEPRADGPPIPSVAAAAPGAIMSESAEAKPTSSPGQALATAAVPSGPRERMLVREADLTIEVSKYASAADAIARLAVREGGFVVSTEQHVTSEVQVLAGRVVIRVPSPRFDAVLASLQKIAAAVEGARSTTNDVTEEFVDVEARLRAKRALEERYLAILASAKTVAETLDVERSLGAVREEIERIEGRRRFLADQAAMSTFRIDLHEPYPALASESGGVGKTLGDAVSKGVDGLVYVLAGLVIFLIGGSPLLVITIVILLIVRAAGKRRKRRKVAAQEGLPHGSENQDAGPRP